MTSLPTPPSTTLDTPSPTETHERLMAPTTPARPIYLIVATSISPPLGIGLRGSLPWPSIRSDMSFFQRATRDSRHQQYDNHAVNAVIMGRKTYDSIPPKFRPLAGRLNVVISRTHPRKFVDSICEDLYKHKKATKLTYGSPDSSPDAAVLVESVTGPDMASILLSDSIEKALSALNEPRSHNQFSGLPIGNIFVIGGTQIYKSMLDLDVPLRILQTQIKKTDGGDFECDTFFPTELEGHDSLKAVSDDEVKSWLRKEGNQPMSLPQGDSEWFKDEKVSVELKVFGWERT